MGTIVVIAPTRPDAPLPKLLSEVAAINNSIPDVYILQGDVTEEGILSAIESGRIRDVDGVWFATDASEEGAALSRTFLDRVPLVQYLSSMNPRWIFFNMCNSEGLVHYIQQRLNIDIIAIQGEIRDVGAWRTGRLFALAYNRLGSVRAALQVAAPGPGQYNYWPAPHMDGNRREEQDRLREVELVIYGNRQSGLPGLASDVRILKSTVVKQLDTLGFKVRIISYIGVVGFVAFVAILFSLVQIALAIR